MTRIIAGAARGRRLQTVPGRSTRPTSDRVREALFSSLESDLGTLAGAAFLDAYAGSGGVGLEARSRGAGPVVLIEQVPAAVAVIRANAAALGFTDVVVVGSPVERQARRASPGGLAFDVCFVDPPYDLGCDELGEVLGALREHGWLKASGRVVVERERRSDWSWPAGFEGVRDRRYGETMLWYGSVALPEED